LSLDSFPTRRSSDLKGYSGLMQTPGMSGYIDLDVRWGVRILKEKLELANYDLKTAIALYKGGNNRLARKQAEEFMRRWRKVSRRSEEHTSELQSRGH